jgi:hypothetical protein
MRGPASTRLAIPTAAYAGLLSPSALHKASRAGGVRRFYGIRVGECGRSRLTRHCLRILITVYQLYGVCAVRASVYRRPNHYVSMISGIKLYFQIPVGVLAYG